MIENPTFADEELIEQRTSLYGRVSMTRASVLFMSHGESRAAIRIIDEEKVFVTKIKGKEAIESKKFELPLEDEREYELCEGKKIRLWGGRMLEGRRNINFEAPLDVQVVKRAVPLRETTDSVPGKDH